MRGIIFMLVLLGVAGPARAERQAIGVFGEWGAFGENDFSHCFAIAQPYRAPGSKGAKASAAVGYWPRQYLRPQLHFRLSRAKRPGSAILLRIDEHVFQMIGRGADAWAPDAAADAAIVAAMRRGVEMRIETRSAGGGRVRDHYRLRGAATAIDAAAIACARG